LAVVYGGRVWHWSWRAISTVVDLAIGIVLLPEFIVTTYRKRNGRRPGTGTAVAGHVAERILDGAAAIYDRHQARTQKQHRRFPYLLAILCFSIPTAAWIVRDQAPDTAVARGVDRGWRYWSDLEGWAHAEGGSTMDG